MKIISIESNKDGFGPRGSSYIEICFTDDTIPSEHYDMCHGCVVLKKTFDFYPSVNGNVTRILYCPKDSSADLDKLEITSYDKIIEYINDYLTQMHEILPYAVTAKAISNNTEKMLGMKQHSEYFYNGETFRIRLSFTELTPKPDILAGYNLYSRTAYATIDLDVTQPVDWVAWKNIILGEFAKSNMENVESYYNDACYNMMRDKGISCMFSHNTLTLRDCVGNIVVNRDMKNIKEVFDYLSNLSKEELRSFNPQTVKRVVTEREKKANKAKKENKIKIENDFDSLVAKLKADVKSD